MPGHSVELRLKAFQYGKRIELSLAGTMATNYSFIKFKKRNSTCKFCLMYNETYLVIVQVLRLVRRLR